MSAIKAAISFVMTSQRESKGALKITSFTIEYLLLAVSNERFRGLLLLHNSIRGYELKGT